MTKRRVLMVGIAAVAVFAAAGCGDDSDDNGTEAEPSATAASDDAGESDAGDDDGSGSGEDGDAGSDDAGSDDAASDDSADAPATASGALVTVGGEEFTFDQEIVCVDMGGAVGASFASSSADIAFDVSLPPEDWESRPEEGWDPPSVRLDDDRLDVPVSWRAGGEVVEGMTGIPSEVAVTSFSVDGSSGAGTATVVDINSVGITDPVVSEMTFEFSCS